MIKNLMGNKFVYISIGSNINPKENIFAGISKLKEFVHIRNISPVFETEPIGPNKKQQNFYNCVLETSLRHDFLPRQFKFEVLRSIESSLGRVRTEDKYSSRTIDLDILLFDDVICSEPELTIPDPDIFDRDFLFAGLLSLNPQLKIYPYEQELITLADQYALDKLRIDCEFTAQLRKEFLE